MTIQIQLRSLHQTGHARKEKQGTEAVGERGLQILAIMRQVTELDRVSEMVHRVGVRPTFLYCALHYGGLLPSYHPNMSTLASW